MQIKEGYYVRTKYGIAQYKEYDTNKGKLLCMPLMNGTFANVEDILKVSENIIDLLEIGDYVNGLPVTKICTDNETEKKYLNMYGSISEWENEDIKSVVTKEQFNSAKYDVEG